VQALSPSMPAELAALPQAEDGLCIVETANGPFQGDQPFAILKNPAITKISGWAVGTKGNVPNSVPPSVFVEFRAEKGSARFYARASRFGRLDVNEAYHSTKLQQSGYQSEVDVTSMPAGRYFIHVLQSNGNRLNDCFTGRGVTVKPGPDR
jgi:hypothetical protein